MKKLLLCFLTTFHLLAAASGIEVTTLDDSGDGSLRQALADVDSGGAITFASALDSGTITLGGSQILLDKDVTIDASGLPGGITISGNGNDNGTLDPGESRIFEVAAGKVVVLRGLRLIKGQVSTTTGDGGAVLNKGDLTLERCLIADSRARDGGGVHGGKITITQCILSGNSVTRFGGGIFAATGFTTTVSQSTISGNSTIRDGGGIWANTGANVQVTQSTFTDNSAVNGLGQNSFGGGFATVNGATVVITQSTFTLNSATTNGGGIFIPNGVSFTIIRSIVAGNLSGGNIAGNATSIVSSLTSGDPMLAPPGDYGGPTQTMPPLPGSPAIDAGGTSDPGFSTDQRGLPRVLGAAVDIGAVEHNAGTLAFGSALTTVMEEEAGEALIPVVRTGDALGSVSVTVDSTPGTATAADFDEVSGLVLEFANAETIKYVPVNILADNLKEPTESFTLTLSNPTGGTELGTPNPGTVRIIDSAPDKAKPALTLLTPKNNEIILEAAGNVANLTGSARDNVGIERVEVSLDGADFLPAVLSHSADFKSCTFALPLPLTPGLRTVLVRAVDTRGLLSTTVKRSFTFRVVRPLQVTVNENGTVTKGYAGVSQRFVGISHTLTATPARGYIFDGWLTNNALTTGLTPEMLNLPKLNFIMQEGLELTARFRENPYTAMVAGSYSGLLMPDLGLRGNDPGVDNTGFFNGTVSSKGTFSGTLLLNGGTARLTGIFDSQGHARFGKDLIRVLTFPRPGVDGQTTFEMRIDTDQTQLNGTLLISRNFQHQTRSSQLTADRAFFSSKYPLEEPVTEKKGRRYNLILPARAQLALDTNLYPQGTGIGRMFVKADGKISLVMHLADNTKFTAASTMTFFGTARSLRSCTAKAVSSPRRSSWTPTKLTRMPPVSTHFGSAPHSPRPPPTALAGRTG